MQCVCNAFTLLGGGQQCEQQPYDIIIPDAWRMQKHGGHCVLNYVEFTYITLLYISYNVFCLGRGSLFLLNIFWVVPPQIGTSNSKQDIKKLAGRLVLSPTHLLSTMRVDCFYILPLTVVTQDILTWSHVT